MLNKFVLKKLYEDYEKSFDKSLDYNPVHLEKLRLLQQYLDSKGYRMPKPRWKFVYDDITTWSHLPGKMFKDEFGNRVKHKPFRNPAFRYKHLL